MDSLLTNAQRCSRKSDTLLKYGLYDDAYQELEKSLVYLNNCKEKQTTRNNVDLVKSLIEQIDGKLRILSLKKEQATRKNNLIDSIVRQRDIDSAVVILSQSSPIPQRSTGNTLSTISNGTKLHKDDKSIIEELQVTNTEYKKLNSFLIDEISQLKHENSYLKEEMKRLVNINEDSNEKTLKNEAIDLSKYIDSDEDDDDEEDIYKRPIEFTVDSS